MQASWQTILDGARAKLRDSEGVIFTNTVLQPHAEEAYRMMWDALANSGINRVLRTEYFNIPAYTSVFSPVANLLVDMAEPDMIRERGQLVTGLIVSASTTTPVTINATGSNVPSQADVVICGVQASVAITTVLIGSGIGTLSLASPAQLQVGSTVKLTGTGADGPYVITQVASPVSFTFAAPGAPNGSWTSGFALLPAPAIASWGRWFATAVDANNFTLNGSRTDGVLGSGGTWSTSSERFGDITPVTGPVEHDVSDRLGEYWWENETIYFRGASQARQIELRYVASGTPPINNTTLLNIDNCQNFLSTYAACLAARSRGWEALAMQYERMALVGPPGAAPDGGYLSDLVSVMVLKMQRQVRVRPNFRQNRNRLYPVWW